MTALDTGFAWASQVAVLGWVCLLAGLVAQGLAVQRAGAVRWASGFLWVGGRLLPVLLCAGYALALARWFGTAEGGFGSLDEVARLFETRGMLLAGWVHYLAFDLWVGRWQVDHLAGKLGAAGAARPAWGLRLATIPCLLMTFLLGPVGLLMFLLLVGLHARLSSQPTRLA
jgi:hypothetical protein